VSSATTSQLNYYNYFTEIEETFVRRRGKNLFLSPLDWALMEMWQERGIPLHIVLRSIESVFDVFDQQPAGTRTIKSLFYCKEEIEAQYREWCASQAGKAADETDTIETGITSDVVAAHIVNAIEDLKNNGVVELREDIERAVRRLHEMQENMPADHETIDKTLGDIEGILDRAMLTKWPAEHLTSLKKEIAAQLKAYKAEMDSESYRTTYELMLLKRLREEAGVPRLSLFYL
jgi:hypothetical protein